MRSQSDQIKLAFYEQVEIERDKYRAALEDMDCTTPICGMPEAPLCKRCEALS